MDFMQKYLWVKKISWDMEAMMAQLLSFMALKTGCIDGMVNRLKKLLVRTNTKNQKFTQLMTVNMIYVMIKMKKLVKLFWMLQRENHIKKSSNTLQRAYDYIQLKNILNQFFYYTVRPEQKRLVIYFKFNF